ncbi:MAG: hypothetical protein RSD67_08245 [Oscillospiraceae bacterium]
MEQGHRDSTQAWKSIVSVVIVIAGCACFVLSSICAMIVSNNRR